MQAVRRRITEILKANGTATVAELAEQLGMAQVSVRHHLDVLIGEDLVQAAGVRRRNGAGRPSQVYMLTANAIRLFPQRHEALANDVLTEVKALLPSDQFYGVLLRMAQRNSRRAPPPTPDQSIEERLDQVAAFLTEEGYNARWERQDNGYVMYACNCPHTGVADHHPELCSMDQALIQLLLPGAVRLESRVLDGSAHCTYAIAPSQAKSTAEA